MRTSADTATAAAATSDDGSGGTGRGLSQKELFVHAVTTSCCAAAILAYRNEPPTGAISWVTFILMSVAANYVVQFICSAILLALYVRAPLNQPTDRAPHNRSRRLRRTSISPPHYAPPSPPPPGISMCSSGCPPLLTLQTARRRCMHGGSLTRNRPTRSRHAAAVVSTIWYTSARTSTMVSRPCTGQCYDVALPSSKILA